MSESSFTFRINAEALEELKTLAGNNNRVASQVVRDFMILYLGKDGLAWANKTLDKFHDKSAIDLSGKFSIRVDEDLVGSFKKAADSNNHTPSKIIRAAIQQYITAKKKSSK